MNNQQQLDVIKTWLKTGSINIFGVPFSGKDTQSKRLAELLNGQMLSSGDIIRKSDRQDVIKLINTGDLAPQQEFINIVLPFLSKPEFAGKPMILSSVGRWDGEQAGVMQAAAAADHPIKAVVHLKLSEQEVWKRHQAAQKLHDRGQRGDEDTETLKRRLEEFRTKTLPVIEFYEEKGLLLEIDGSTPPEQVTSAILASLADYAASS